MNADHRAQLRLLDLQAADTALAQLAHRRSTLPELARLAERDAQATALQHEAVDARTRLDDVSHEQRRLENEVETVRSRATRDEQRMQNGGLPPKELEGLQHELITLARRQSTLEDELLEVMEQREEAEASVRDVNGRVSALDAERAALGAARDAAFRDIDEASAARTGERSLVAADIPPELMTLYERAREHGGGVGAAMLRQRRCEGCHIELSGSELASVRAAAADAVVRCDNCRRILVRTPESAL